jgi:hypothetical protein
MIGFSSATKSPRFLQPLSRKSLTPSMNDRFRVAVSVVPTGPGTLPAISWTGGVAPHFSTVAVIVGAEGAGAMATSGFISMEGTEIGNLSPSSIVGNVDIPTWGAVTQDGVMDGKSIFG